MRDERESWRKEERGQAYELFIKAEDRDSLRKEEKITLFNQSNIKWILSSQALCTI